MDIKKGNIILLVLFFMIISILLYGFNLSDYKDLTDKNSTSAYVKILDGENSILATVEVEIADTQKERYIGLSNTENLNYGSGMLFVFNQEQEQTFVMRDMNFPLDIIFIDSNRYITEIHHAPITSNNNLTGYSGNAKWVLEVPKGYTSSRNVSIGDRVRFNLG